MPSQAQWALDPTTRAVALTVLRHGPISRAGVARRLGLSSGSLTRITKPLLQLGIVAEGQPGPAEVGRPSVPLRIVEEAAYVIGVKLIPGRAFSVLTGLTGKVLREVETECDTSSPAAAAAHIAAVVRRLARGRQILGVGVALPASVAAGGEIYAARMLGWHGGNLEREVAQRSGFRCASANDVDAMTLAEHWFGAGRGASSFVTVTFGAGIGVGAVIDDHLLLGHQGAAALMGRLWLPDGRLFQDVLSIAEVERRASRAVGRRLDFDGALTAPKAAAVVEDVANAIGQLARAAAIAFSPERILLTGEGIQVLTGREHLVPMRISEDWREDLDLPELVTQPLSYYAWSRGAAALAIRAELSSY